MTLTTQHLAWWGLCAPLIGIGIYLLRRTHEVRKWQAVDGSILRFDTQFTRYGGLARIRYQYEVNGRSFEGDRISIWDWLFAQGAYQTHRLGRRFPRGAPAKVYSDPIHPEQSVLLRPSYLWPLGFLFLGIGIATYFAVVRPEPLSSDSPTLPPSF